MFNFSNFFSFQFWTAPKLRTKQNKEDEVHKICFDPSGWTKMQMFCGEGLNLFGNNNGLGLALA